MSYKPYFQVAKAFSTWFRLRVMMAFNLVLSALLAIVSGIQYANVGGDWQSNWGGTTFPDWVKNVCDASPYEYLRPFRFKVSVAGVAYSNASYCTWPATNNNMRFCISVIAALTVFILYVRTPLSRVARTLMLFWALMHFAAFILDVNQSIIGQKTCSSSFSGTALGNALTSAGAIVSCDMVNYPGVCILDLIQALGFFTMFECWGMCENLYNQKSVDSSAVELSSSKPSTKGGYSGTTQSDLGLDDDLDASANPMHVGVEAGQGGGGTKFVNASGPKGTSKSGGGWCNIL